MITEKVLRERKRKFERQIENYAYKMAGPETPQTEELYAKTKEARAAIVRIDKALELFKEAKKPEYPPLLLGTDPMIPVAPPKVKLKGKRKKKTPKKDKVAFALDPK